MILWPEQGDLGDRREQDDEGEVSISVYVVVSVTVFVFVFSYDFCQSVSQSNPTYRLSQSSIMCWVKTQKMSENGKIYNAGKNSTLPLAVT